MHVFWDYVVEYVDKLNSKESSQKGYAHLTYKTSLDENGYYTEWKHQKVFAENFNYRDLSSENNLTASISSFVTFDNFNVSLNAPIIYNYLPVRSEQIFTKFVGLGQGNLVVNGKSHPAKITVSTGYNNLYSGIDIKEYGINTRWLYYFGHSEDVYHFDYTNIAKQHVAYKSHKYFSSLTIDDSLSELARTQIYGDSYTVSRSDNVLSIFSDKSSYKNTFTLGPGYFSDQDQLYKNYLIYNDFGDIGLYLEIN